MMDWELSSPIQKCKSTSGSLKGRTSAGDLLRDEDPVSRGGSTPWKKRKKSTMNKIDGKGSRSGGWSKARLFWKRLKGRLDEDDG
jgi:hypothetical protein